MSTRLLPLLLLAVSAPALATPTMLLRTYGTPVPGEPLLLRLSGVPVGATATFAAGTPTSGLGVCPLGLPVCLNLLDARVIGRGVGSTNGSVEVQVVVPEGMAPGTTVAFQAVVATTGDLSFPITRTVSEPIQIQGVFDDPSIGGQLELDSGTLVDDIHTAQLSDFDNATGVAFASYLRQNGVTYWQRLEWTEQGGVTWFCLTLPNANESIVRLQTHPDRTSPATTGCLGQPWMPLLPVPPELAGTWTAPSGAMVYVDEATWSWGAAGGTTSRFSNASSSLIGHLDRPAALAGGWVRLDWTWSASGTPLVCGTGPGATEWSVRSAPAPDAANPAHGCHGRAWVPLAP